MPADRAPTSTALITGASRGLGLELVRQYLADGWRVHACCRAPDRASGLAALQPSPRLLVHPLDVTRPESVRELAASLRDEPLDVLINGAGLIGWGSFAEKGVALQPFGGIDYDEWRQVFDTNVFGPMRVAEALAGNVERSRQRKIVTLSSVVGSVARNRAGGLYAYRSSKSALNQVMKSMSIDLAKRGIIALPMHPGWVRTDMGGPGADLDVATSVSGLRAVIARLQPADAGRFLSYAGEELPW